MTHEYGRKLLIYSERGHLLLASVTASVQLTTGALMGRYPGGGITFASCGWTRDGAIPAEYLNFSHHGFLAHRDVGAQVRLDHNTTVIVAILFGLPHWVVICLLIIPLIFLFRGLWRRTQAAGIAVKGRYRRLAGAVLMTGAVSLLIFVFSLTCAVWIRSFWATPVLEREDIWEEENVPWEMGTHLILQMQRGNIQFIVDNDTATPPGTTIRFRMERRPALYTFSEDPISSHLKMRRGFLGFLYIWDHDTFDLGPVAERGYSGGKAYLLTAHIHLPCWLAAMILGGGLVICLRSLRRRYIRSVRLRAGLCPHCGYDLRASARCCPECGLAVATIAPMRETFDAAPSPAHNHSQ